MPDVAADAAPGTGYRLVVGGRLQIVGGTSAVAPLWAGLTALINQAAARPIGFFLPVPVCAPSSCCDRSRRETTFPAAATLGYEAGPGWNACTGLGVPLGQALFAALTQQS